MIQPKLPRWIVCLAMFGFVCGSVCRGYGQSADLIALGFKRIESTHMTLVTDLELDDELHSWPSYLDQSIEQWKQIFRPEPSQLLRLHATVYLIGDRAKWETAGLLKEVPFLQDGYQLGNKLYVVEQPSVFYRRMLFLHEATHWIMYEWLGGGGSPWLMEGMADYLSTHKLDADRVTLGYFPVAAQEVPWWGRILQVQNSMKQGDAPKLSQILSFPDMRQRRMDRYCWSWAAVYFFDHHPEFGEDFRSLYRGDLDYSLTASKQLYDYLEGDWQKISIQWRCFLDDLDFGYSPQLMLRFGKASFSHLKSGEAQTFSVQADRGWQSTGLVLEAGDSIRLSASGSVIVKQLSNLETWRATPKGVSAEYTRGERLGALVAVLAPLNGEQPSKGWDRILVGNDRTMQATERSCLLLRVNDTVSGISDNSGAFTAKISTVP